jgi:hypothetical protein
MEPRSMSCPPAVGRPTGTRLAGLIAEPVRYAVTDEAELAAVSVNVIEAVGSTNGVAVESGTMPVICKTTMHDAPAVPAAVRGMFPGGQAGGVVPAGAATIAKALVVAGAVCPTVTAPADKLVTVRVTKAPPAPLAAVPKS